MEKVKGIVYSLLCVILFFAIMCVCGTSDYEDAQRHAQHPNYGKYEQALLR